MTTSSVIPLRHSDESVEGKSATEPGFSEKDRLGQLEIQIQELSRGHYRVAEEELSEILDQCVQAALKEVVPLLKYRLLEIMEQRFRNLAPTHFSFPPVNLAERLRDENERVTLAKKHFSELLIRSDKTRFLRDALLKQGRVARIEEGVRSSFGGYHNVRQHMNQLRTLAAKQFPGLEKCIVTDQCQGYFFDGKGYRP